MAVITGSSGNDDYVGAEGVDDTAVIATSSANASFAFNGVNWTVTSDQGVDTLTSIEKVRFDDGTISIAGNFERQVNSYSTGEQSRTRTTTLANGDYVVTWQSNAQDGSGYGVYAQLYSAAGDRIGAETQINTSTSGNQTDAMITGLTDGGYLVTWSDAGSYAMQRYSAAGVAVNGQVALSTAPIRAVTSTADGGFAIINTGQQIRTYTADGVAVSTLNIPNTNGYTAIDITTQANGTLVSLGRDSVGSLIVSVFTNGTTTSPTTIANNFYSANAAIAAHSAGGFVVAYTSGSVLYVQRQNANGSAATNRITIANSGEVVPTVETLSDGSYVVAWNNGSGVFAQRVSAAGVKLGDVLKLNIDAVSSLYQELGIVGTPDGGYTVTWTSKSGADADIVSQHVTADNQVQADRLTGDGADNSIRHGGANRVDIDGGAGNDTLVGGNGADNLFGNDGNDLLDGGLGVNRLDGGAGTDVVLAVTGATFSYGSNWVLSSPGKQEILTSVERARFEAGVVSMEGGTETVLNNAISGAQFAGEATALTGGGYVVTWSAARSDGTGQDIIAQRFDGAGNEVGAEVTVSGTLGATATPVVTGLSDGGYAVVWYTSNGVRTLQRFAADGTAAGTATTLSGATIGELASLPGGGFVRAYVSTGTLNDIFIQRYTATGALDGAAVAVNSFTVGDQTNAQVASMSNGRFVVVWQSAAQDGSGSGIYMQRFTAAGVADGAETRVNSYTPGAQTDPAVTILSGGGFAVAWASAQTAAGGSGIVVQRFNSSGVKLGGEIVLPSAIGGATTIQGLPDGSFVVGWMTGSGVFTQRFTATGEKSGDVLALHSELPTSLAELSIVATSDGGYTAIWSSSDTNGSGVVAQHVKADNSIDLSTLTGLSGDNVITYNGENRVVINGGGGDDTLSGGTAGDFLNGEAGSDTLRGGNGADTISGGADGDTLYGDSGNDIIAGDDGDDIIDGGFENDQLSGGAGNDSIIGGWGLDTLSGDAGDDVLDGQGDNDIINGGAGLDWLIGGVGNDVLNGGDDNDRLEGGDGNDTLDGGAGKDVMIGGDGDDNYYIDTEEDRIIELADGGTDTVFTAAGYTITNIQIENATLTGSASVDLTGSRLSNILTGNAGDNRLNGGAGADQMRGGLGDDTYVVDNAGDIVTEAANAGTDTVISAVSYMLGANVETLRLVGTAITGTGNALDNLIVGNAYDNVLDGQGGADRMQGGNGNDVYIVRGGEQLLERAGQGNDRVESTVSWALGDNFEDLFLRGAGHINATGNALNNVLLGNTGNNILDGGEGADTMEGGQGDDTYIVDNIGDVATDSGGGTDLVRSTVSWTLSYGIENLTLLGATNIDGTGNALDNVIRGNGGRNSLSGGNGGQDTLIGGAGNDTLYGIDGLDRLIGGTGDDVYIVNGDGDEVVELTGQGYDSVTATVSRSYTLAQNVERLVLVGLNVDGFGNSLDNEILGTTGDNLLDGAAGADRLVGYEGDDSYLVDNVGDVVVEAANQGTDEVLSKISWTLGANLENLTLTGAAAINGIGNALDNRISGNDANNTLRGGIGSDIIIGGAGTDLLYGEDGDDILSGGVGNDRIDGGAGFDTVSYSAASGGVTINLLLTTQQPAGAAGSDILVSIENVDGTNLYGDILFGNAGANVLRGLGGNDTLLGGDGNDTLQGGEGDDIIRADAGNDRIDGGNGVDKLSFANIAANVIVDLNITTGQNTRAGLDVIRNIENVDGSQTGNDSLTGDDGDNQLSGLGGNDTLAGGDGADLLDGGAGIDTVDYSGAYDGIIANLATGLGTDQSGSTDRYVAIENLIGSEFDDRLIGDAGANRLTGGLGQDYLTGGAGADMFVFRSTAETGLNVLSWDIIRDFERGADRIDLSGIDANEATVAIDAFNAMLDAGTAFTAAGQLRFENGILYGNTDADAAAEFAIRVDGVTVLGLGDFVL
jgi:Ca2+-binding RTX toxin-like protein